jgi:chemotaxis receptor (MCP) glutamine deamidase CheD
MDSPSRELVVAPDRFEVVTDDAVLRAELESAIAVCVYDAVDEGGALLHLRFILRGQHRADVTDTTLATELLLLDRCILTLREAAPGARYLQARIAAHLPEDAAAMAASDAMVTLIGHFLRDAGATVAPADVSVGARRMLRFRPSMGWLQVK